MAAIFFRLRGYFLSEYGRNFKYSTIGLTNSWQAINHKEEKFKKESSMYEWDLFFHVLPFLVSKKTKTVNFPLIQSIVDYCVTIFSKGSQVCRKICHEQYVGFFALVLLVPLSISVAFFLWHNNNIYAGEFIRFEPNGLYDSVCCCAL